MDNRNASKIRIRRDFFSARPEVIICEKPPAVVLVGPIVEMDLVQVRSYTFFAEFERLSYSGAHCRNSNPCTLLRSSIV